MAAPDGIDPSGWLDDQLASASLYMLRSRTSLRVEQEARGILALHRALRKLIHDAAAVEGWIPTGCPSPTPSRSSGARSRAGRFRPA